MKRTELLRKLTAIAKAKGFELVLVREGGNHTIYAIGPEQFPVGRHNDIPEITAKATLKAAEAVPAAPKEDQ